MGDVRIQIQSCASPELGKDLPNLLKAQLELKSRIPTEAFGTHDKEARLRIRLHADLGRARIKGKVTIIDRVRRQMQFPGWKAAG